MHADEGVSARGMPHAPSGGISLVGNPYVRIKIVKFVILDRFLGVSDYLEDHHILAVRQHERLFLSEGGVVFGVNPI